MDINNTNDKNVLIKLPEDMDIPSKRRNLNNPENVRWLVRNLFIQNGNHSQFEEIMNKLKGVVK